MPLTITARHFDLVDAHKHHAERAIQRLSRYFDHIINTDLILTHEKYRYTAELMMQVYGTVLTSKEEAGEVAAAIDQAAEKMERQLKKYKAKLQSHRMKRGPLPETKSTPA